jgi:hypothetical protein
MVNVEKRSIALRIVIRKPEGKKPLEELIVDGRICKNVL